YALTATIFWDTISTTTHSSNPRSPCPLRPGYEENTKRSQLRRLDTGIDHLRRERAGPLQATRPRQRATAKTKMSMLAGFRRWLQRKQYHFEVTLSVYMFTPWEKFAFYSILFLLFSLAFIAAILYLPHHVSILAGRAWYYIQGEDIGVAASAREAVKGISAGVLSGEAVPTAVRVKEALRTVDKEL
ncbi:Uncharacterized protein TPAR_03356, partial [Tolypocladium paradoxum]